MGSESSDEAAVKRGIFDCKEAYRTPTSLDFRRLFESGMVIVDTNVLINLYRSNERTRRDTFAVLNRLKQQLWVPGQVIEEFWRIRDLPSIKGHHRAKSRTACTALDKNFRSMSDAVDRWLKDVHLETDEAARRRIRAYTDRIESSLEEMKRYIKKQAESDALEGTDATHTDPVLVQLEPLLYGRIGAPLPPDELTNAVREAKSRAEKEIPPGYADFGSKPDEQAAGDYIIWRQVISEAAQRRRDVLLITGDIKEDWWTPRGGENPARPRAELVNEMRKDAGVELFMMTPSQLLAEASAAFSLAVDERSVSDLASSEGTSHPLSQTTRDVIVNSIESAHERALAVHRASGLSERSPYGIAMTQVVMENLKERVIPLGGDTLTIKGFTFPMLDGWLIAPLRSAAGQTPARFLSSRRMQSLKEYLAPPKDMLTFEELNRGNTHVVVVHYGSTPQAGVEYVEARVGMFDGKGNFVTLHRSRLT
jgi:predicted nucleic acid-binding protein